MDRNVRNANPRNLKNTMGTGSRNSNHNHNTNPVLFSKAQKQWRVGEYLRLSKDDEVGGTSLKTNRL